MKRRRRYRRVAIRHAQIKSLDLKTTLLPNKVDTVLSVDAAEFKPGRLFVEIEWESFVFNVRESDILDSAAPGCGSVPSRRAPREANIADSLHNVVTPAVQECFLLEVEDTTVPVRKALRDHRTAEGLSPPQAVDAVTCSVQNDTGGRVARRLLREPCVVESLPIVPAEAFEKDLAMFANRCKGLLDHLGRAAKTVDNAKLRHAQDGIDAVVQAFFEDYFDLLDPVGIEESLEDIWRVESALCETEVGYLGHLFAFSRPQFLDTIQNGPKNKLRELHAHALELPPGGDLGHTSHTENSQSILGLDLSKKAYEALSHKCDATAFAWQHVTEDDDVLLGLKRQLREYVIAVECLIYV